MKPVGCGARSTACSRRGTQQDGRAFGTTCWTRIADCKPPMKKSPWPGNQGLPKGSEINIGRCKMRIWRIVRLRLQMSWMWMMRRSSRIYFILRSLELPPCVVMYNFVFYLESKCTSGLSIILSQLLGALCCFLLSVIVLGYMNDGTVKQKVIWQMSENR